MGGYLDEGNPLTLAGGSVTVPSRLSAYGDLPVSVHGVSVVLARPELERLRDHLSALLGDKPAQTAVKGVAQAVREVADELAVQGYVAIHRPFVRLAELLEGIRPMTPDADISPEEAPVIDPTEALAVGAQVVSTMSWGLPRRKRGTAPECAQVALEIARFLVESTSEVTAESTEDDSEGDGRVDLTQAVTVGPARKVMCAAEAGDYAYCRAGRSQGRPFVGIEISADGERSHVVLTVPEARAYAAGILDAADEAEGGSPLLNFVKPEETP